MILRPHDLPPDDNCPTISGWEAVARTQRAPASSYALVRQPDHARLAGALAAHLHIEGRPQITGDIIQGISLHDEGWSAFDSGAEQLQATPARYSGDVPLSPDGKPLSFLDIKAADFLRAWRGSIDVAEAVAPIAGLIVSGHFYRLGKFGIDSGHYSGPDAALVQQFLREEKRRRERLSQLEKRSPDEVEYWTDVLQLCDLLSLYLCCGSQAAVEFPQRIADSLEPARLHIESDTMILSPSLFPRPVQFTVAAHDFPHGEAMRLTWKLA